MKNILVVDDEASIVQLCQIVFESAGYAVQCAYSGKQALHAVSQTAPDLAVLDVMMPGMDGVELCRRLREDASLPQTLVILMYTADDSSSTKQRCLEAGANAVINKLTSVEDLLRTVGSYLTKSATAPLPG